jgi:hypothetical protein
MVENIFSAALVQYMQKVMATGKLPNNPTVLSNTGIVLIGMFNFALHRHSNQGIMTH